METPEAKQRREQIIGGWQARAADAAKAYHRKRTEERTRRRERTRKEGARYERTSEPSTTRVVATDFHHDGD